MKNYLLFSLIFVCCVTNIVAQTPTFADPPGPEHVLVVYKVPDPEDPADTISFATMNYYKDARQIPDMNIVELSLPSDTMITYEGVTHLIELTQQGEIIKDRDNENTLTPTIHAWLYFNEKIAKPIANYLTTTYVNGTPLKDIIRFIVLVKGVPFRIDARKEDAESYGTNVICANLLTHLGETMEDPDALLFYYNKTPGILNPYFNVDANFSMEHHFLPNHYQTTGHGRTIKLSYLVTHLSAPRFEDIQGMIDRSLDAIYATDYDWFIDADPTPCMGWNPIGNTTTILDDLAITNKVFDNTETVFFSHPNPIISYSSNGTWTSIGTGCTSMVFNENYIQTQLTFDYADGAFFSTLESHNGLSIGTYPVIRTRGQGLIADFTLMGGTVGVGQAFHSPGSHVIRNDIFFPSYAVGYTFIEAAYLGLGRLDATNVVVGDPLTRIYNYQIDTLSSNIVLSNTTIKHKIVVPAGITLTLAGTISFERNAQLIIQGGLAIQDNSNIDFGNLSYLKTPNIVIGSGVNFTFKGKSRFEINNSISVGTNSFLTIKENATGTVPSMEIMGGTYFSIMDNGTLNVAGNVVVHTGSTLSLGSNCRINSNTGLFMPGSFCNLSGNAVLQFNNLTVNPGCSLTVANNSKLEAINKFISIGNENSKIYYSSNASGVISASGVDSILFRYSEFNGALLNVENNQSVNNPAKPVEVTNCEFINGNAGLVLWSTTAPSQRIDMSNCIFTDLNTSAISLGNNCYAEIEDVIITGTVNSEQQNAIIVESVYDVIINDLTITDYGYGVTTARREGLTEILSVSLFTLENSAISCEYPVFLNSQEASFGSITLFNLILSNGSGAGGTAITINGADRGQLRIGNNSCSGFEYGIQITNSNNFSLTKNTVTNCFNGIQLNNVNNYFLIKNNLTGISSSVGIGVDNFSSTGLLRNNTITNYLTGILSNNSTSVIGMYGNNITQNNLGVELFEGAIDMRRNLLSLDGNIFYSNLYGNNIIKENGTDNCSEEREEIHIENGNLLVEYGCNTISDDRHDGLSCEH